MFQQDEHAQAAAESRAAGLAIMKSALARPIALTDMQLATGAPVQLVAEVRKATQMRNDVVPFPPVRKRETPPPPQPKTPAPLRRAAKYDDRRPGDYLAMMIGHG